MHAQGFDAQDVIACPVDRAELNLQGDRLRGVCGLKWLGLFEQFGGRR